MIATETAINTILTGGQSYGIGNRRLTRPDLKPLLDDWRSLKPVIMDGDPLHVKDVLLMHIGMLQPKNGKEAIKVSHLGHKIYEQVMPEIELEDAEFELLEKVMAEPKMTVVGIAPVFEEIEKAKE